MSAYSAVYGQATSEYDSTGKTIEDVIDELKSIRAERDSLLIQKTHIMDSLTQARNKVERLEKQLTSLSMSKLDLTDRGDVPHLRLGQVISALKDADPEKVISPAFDSADSYRGSYDQLAFSPCASNTVANMLRIALDALNSTFSCYKGGDYYMDENTKCVIASYGLCSLDNKDKLRLLEVMKLVSE